MTTSAQTPLVIPRKTWLTWVRENLFNNWYNSLLTLILGTAVIWTLVGLVGALLAFEYAILRANLRLFMIGRFPGDQLWRPWASGMSLVLAASVGAGLISSRSEAMAARAGMPFRRASLRQTLRRMVPVLLLIAIILGLTETLTPVLLTFATVAVGVGGFLLGRLIPVSVNRFGWVLVVLLVLGGYLALAAGPGGVGWEGWGGLHLNVFLALAGIMFAFPLGLLLALGRRSSLPLIRYLSVTYIEVIRGVPLIAVLLAGANALGFLLPEALRPSMITRMLIAITAFQAAYIAEVVRGGLQALPRGQTEAGQSLGLSAFKTVRLIVLPQALRFTIPPMVGQFIALFKDTTLVWIIGILELLRAATIAPSQADFLGRPGVLTVSLGFAALIFWVGSYTMSREAKRLEKKLGVGER